MIHRKKTAFEFKISGVGTMVILLSIATSYLLLEPNVRTTENAGLVARIVGGALVVSLLFELREGYRNLIRTDILAITGLYFLTLFEFLFPQEELDTKISPEQAYGGLELILTGIFFLAIGRHIYRRPLQPMTVTAAPYRINLRLLVILFYLCFFIGFFYILLKVNFNPFVMIERAMGPRFSQPWARGRLGGAFVFLSELQLFTYAVPPLAGIILNHRKQLSAFQFILILTLLSTTFFMGFVGGTRNIFLSYLIGFVGGYILAMPQISLKKLIIPGAIILMLAYLGATYMVQFRSIGLKRFLDGQRDSGVNEGQVYVDHNLYTIGVLRQVFPDRFDYLGTEVWVWALVKPVPRVLWPGKPEGLSKSMEEVAGAQGYTLASTYVGESYMAGGFTAVILISLLFGYMAAWWNTKAYGQMTDERLLIFALGLFVAAITMRSLFMFTTAVLPILGVNILVRYLRK